MEGAFDPSRLEEARPHLFYLEDEELAELADSVWVVRGVELPVHSQIVSQKSRVLRDAYKESATNVGFKRSREEARDRTRLSFDGHDLAPVALFLYFLYHPEHAAAANMGKLGERLPALARLAYKYQVSRLLGAIEDWLMAPEVAYKTPTQLLASLELAEDLHLDRLAASTLLSLARLLGSSSVTSSGSGTANNRIGHSGGSSSGSGGAGGGGGLLETLLEVGQLRLGTAHLRVLLAMLAAALRQAPAASQDLVLSKLPGLEAVVKWGRLQGVAGELVWDVDVGGFPQLAAAATAEPVKLEPSVPALGLVHSPQLQLGGHRWRMECWPAGEPGCEGHLSLGVILETPDPQGTGVITIARVTVVNQGDAAASISQTLNGRLFKRGAAKWGLSKFAPLGLLAAAGFVVDGALRVKLKLVC